MTFYFEKELSIEAISDCYFKSFNKEFDVGYWNWRFLNNPISDKVYISYIEEKGILKSYYAVSPCLLDIDGYSYRTALSNMTMTHPDSQGKGYFKTLARELYGVLKDDAFIGVYGFANSSSHYGFRKYLNWVDLASVNLFRINKSLFRSYLLKDRTYLSQNSKVDNNSIALAEEMLFNTGNISVLRNTLEWKFNNPLHDYYVSKIIDGSTPVGLIFYKYFEESIDIMEFFYAQDYSCFDVFGAGIESLLTRSNKFINIWSNLYSKEHLYLEKLGFFESNFNSYFGFIPFFPNKELLDIKNWHYRFIDSDMS